ncbi:MAG: hypothetical protein PHN80_10780 [Hespellia sp.]|nr:hypothetical protein [Hespellia sp.]
MQQLEQMINIYHTAFIVSLILFIVFLAVTIFLFFFFDIRKIFDIRTGRGAKRKIQKMEEINAQTGKLRQDMVGQTPSVLSPEERITYPVTSKIPIDEINQQLNTEAASKTEDVNPGKGLDVNGIQETTILQQSQNQDKQEQIELPGLFQINKSTMWIHTEEVI